MSTPMYDTPEHLPIGVNEGGQGPVMEHEAEFSHYTCWCANPNCMWAVALLKNWDPDV